MQLLKMAASRLRHRAPTLLVIGGISLTTSLCAACSISFALLPTLEYVGLPLNAFTFGVVRLISIPHITFIPLLEAVRPKAGFPKNPQFIILALIACVISVCIDAIVYSWWLTMSLAQRTYLHFHGAIYQQVHATLCSSWVLESHISGLSYVHL